MRFFDARLRLAAWFEEMYAGGCERVPLLTSSCAERAASILLDRRRECWELPLQALRTREKTSVEVAGVQNGVCVNRRVCEKACWSPFTHLAS